MRLHKVITLLCLIFCCFGFTIPNKAEPAFEYKQRYKIIYDNIYSIFIPTDKLKTLAESLTEYWWINNSLPTVVFSPQRFIVDSNGQLSIDTNNTMTMIWPHPLTNTNILSVTMKIKNVITTEKTVRAPINFGVFSGLVFRGGDNAEIYPYVCPVFRIDTFGLFYTDIGVGMFYNKIGFTFNISMRLYAQCFFSFGYTGSIYNDKLNSFMGTGVTFDIW